MPAYSGASRSRRFGSISHRNWNGWTPANDRSIHSDQKLVGAAASVASWSVRMVPAQARPPVAQWIRATDFGSVGRGFESLRAGHRSTHGTGPRRTPSGLLLVKVPGVLHADDDGRKDEQRRRPHRRWPTEQHAIAPIATSITNETSRRAIAGGCRGAGRDEHHERDSKGCISVMADANQRACRGLPGRHQRAPGLLLASCGLLISPADSPLGDDVAPTSLRLRLQGLRQEDQQIPARDAGNQHEPDDERPARLPDP